MADARKPRQSAVYDLVKEAPPAVSSGRAAGTQVYDLLEKVKADDSGEFYRIATSYSRTGANSILTNLKKPGRPLPAPLDEWEFTTRTFSEDGGSSRLYARYIGPAGAKEKAAADAVNPPKRRGRPPRTATA